MTSNDLKASAKDISSRASQAADDVKSAAQKIGSDAGDQAAGVAGQVRSAATDLYGKAQDNFRAALDKAPSSASDAVSTGQRLYKQSSHRVGRQVIKQPIETLILAGAIGYLVGWATNRS